RRGGPGEGGCSGSGVAACTLNVGNGSLIAANRIARSFTQFAISPTWSIDGASGTTPSVLMRLYVGLIPQTPQNDAGRVIDPPVCDASAPRHMPQATAAALPLLLPPGVHRRFHGLRVGGGSELAEAVVTVLPIRTAPA